MRYSSAIGIDVLVRGDLEHAVGRRVDDRPAGAHVLGAEPIDDLGARRDDVAERAAADAPLELGDDVRRKTRRETSGNGRSSTMPIISQCPVTESLPGDASAMRPKAPRGVAPAPASPRRAARRGRGPATAASGRAAATCAAMLPSVLLPSSPYARGVRQLADADAVEHDDDDATWNATALRRCVACEK